VDEPDEILGTHRMVSRIRLQSGKPFPNYGTREVGNEPDMRAASPLGGSVFPEAREPLWVG
jgi:hypothetical protein